MLTISAPCAIGRREGTSSISSSELTHGNGYRERAGTVRRDDVVLCPTHSADADCAEIGHAWDDWYALPSDPETEYRYCEHCSAGEERRINRKRHTLVRHPAPRE